MKKKFVCVLLTMLLLCLATGCDNNKDKTPGDFAGSTPSPSPTPESTMPPSSVVPSEAESEFEPSLPSFESEEGGVIDDIGDTAGEVIDDAGDGVKDIVDGIEDVADDLTGTKRRSR